ncbi:hypothetical protein [Actinocorallia sp. A-T 12471]|uniref:DUF7927 domain-containing protein n=1 Tax=Actinocorallia sp. A-T 12471 TaxID=3089813 RepID=UPI0039B70095
MFDLTSRRPLESSGVWQQSRVNPALPDQCGLDVALLLDLSGSVGGALPALKGAADQFADALVGTPSRMALFSFNSDAPATGGSNHPELVSVSTQDGADAFKAQYAGWTVGGGTNWDQGLWRIAQASQQYDLVVIITDGNPTYFDDRTGDGGNTRVAEVEGGIFSANAVKAKGSRLIALGVGGGVTGVTALNLRAISGTSAYDGTNAATADYFQTSDYAAAGEALRRLILQQCAGSVSVTKLLVPSANVGDDVTGAIPAGAGWQFDGATTTAGATITPASATTADDGTGTVAFTVGGDAANTAVQITEVEHDGYTILQRDGVNAVCSPVGSTTPLPVTNAGETGFALTVPQGAAVNCSIYNKPVGTANVTVTKVWSIDGTTYAEGDQPAGFTASATLTGPGSTPVSSQPWGTPRNGYTIGEQVTVDETVTVPDPCRVTSQVITLIDDEDSEEQLPHTGPVLLEHATFQITNTVTCPPTAPVVVDKQWVIDGKHYAEGHQPDGFTAGLTLSGQDGVPGTPQDWDVPRGGFVVGGTVTIDETTGQFDNERCTLVSSRLTVAGGADVDLPLPHTATVTGPDPDVFEITNTVECADEPGLGITKRADRTEVAPGGRVTYTVTITNTGDGDTPEGSPATFQDDLSDVLREAVYDDDAVVVSGGGTVSYNAPVLSWTGPLEAGASATVAYSVTVDADAPHRTRLCNTATAPGADCSDTNCVQVTAPVVTPPSPRPPWHHGKPGHHGKPWHHHGKHHGKHHKPRPSAGSASRGVDVDVAVGVGVDVDVA